MKRVALFILAHWEKMLFGFSAVLLCMFVLGGLHNLSHGEGNHGKLVEMPQMPLLYDWKRPPAEYLENSGSDTLSTTPFNIVLKVKPEPVVEPPKVEEPPPKPPEPEIKEPEPIEEPPPPVEPPKPPHIFKITYCGSYTSLTGEVFAILMTDDSVAGATRKYVRSGEMLQEPFKVLAVTPQSVTITVPDGKEQNVQWNKTAEFTLKD